MRVVVTGAPDSGVPALLRVLRAALQAPSADTDAGDGAVTAFDARLLERLGWFPGALPADAPATSRPDAAGVEEGRAMLAGPARPDGRGEGVGVPADAAPEGPIGDAAIGVLLPWWRRGPDDRLVLVVPVEAPVRAAWRAAATDDTEPELQLAGWLAWHRHLAAGAAGLPAILVDAAALRRDGPGVRSAVIEALAGLGCAIPEGATTTLPAVDAVAAWTEDGTAEPPPDARLDTLATQAVAALAGWLPHPVVVAERLALTVPAPEPWEIGALALGRRLAALRATRTAERAAAAAREAELRDAGARMARLEAADARAQDLEARLAAAEEDAADGEARLAALRAEHDAALARIAAMTAQDAARQEELRSAAERERVLGAAHLDRTGTLVGRVATRWTRLGDRVGAVRAGDRVAESVLQVATLRRPRILRPHPLFDAAWYLERYADVRAQGTDPYRHYRRHGSREGRSPNAYLDADWYRARYPDVRDSGEEPMDHYHEHGWREGRDPGPGFRTAWYLHRYPDVLVDGVDPLEHFLRHGRAEGRSPVPDDGRRWEADASGIAVAFAAGAGGDGGGADTTTPDRRPRSWAEDLAAALPALPGGSRNLVLAERGDALPTVAGRSVAWLVPAPSGMPGGHFPASGRAAIIRLEAARWDGVDHLLAHRDQAWWLAREPELTRHLERYPRVPLGGVPFTAWRLRPAAWAGTDTPDELPARIRRSVGRDLATLAWGVPPGDLAARLGGVVFAPAQQEAPLPYLDASIDVVVVATDEHATDEQATDEDATVAEARRIATHAVLRLAGGRRDLEPVWLAPELAEPARVVVALIGSAGRPVSPDQVTRVLDSIVGTSAEALLVVIPADRGITPDDAPGPSLGARIESAAATSSTGRSVPVRLLPLPGDATPSARAAAVARATDAELVALLDGRAMPIPGWLPGLTAALEADAAVSVAVPLLVRVDGTLPGSDDRDVGDSRTLVVRPVDVAGTAALMLRRADLIAATATADPTDGSPETVLTFAPDGRSILLASPGHLEPSALAIVGDDPEPRDE